MGNNHATLSNTLPLEGREQKRFRHPRNKLTQDTSVWWLSRRVSKFNVHHFLSSNFFNNCLSSSTSLAKPFELPDASDLLPEYAPPSGDVAFPSSNFNHSSSWAAIEWPFKRKWVSIMSPNGSGGSFRFPSILGTCVSECSNKKILLYRCLNNHAPDVGRVWMKERKTAPLM